MILDIRLDSDKKTVAAILLDNGYTVRRVVVAMDSKNGKRRRAVLEAWKDEETQGEAKEWETEKD